MRTSRPVPPTRWCCRRTALPISSAMAWLPSGSRPSRRTEAGEPARSHPMLRSCIAFAVTLAAFAFSTLTAFALTLEVTHAGPSVVGQAHAFTAVVAEANGAVTLEWKFGEAGEFQAGGVEMSHTFTEPGHYSIDVVAIDAAG